MKSSRSSKQHNGSLGYLSVEPDRSGREYSCSRCTWLASPEHHSAIRRPCHIRGIRGCFYRIAKCLPNILLRRKIAPGPVIAALGQLERVVHSVEPDTYSAQEDSARQRIGRRDHADWPILACVMALNCPVWTEDTDFFGCGVATWTTDTVELFLRQFDEES